MLEMVNNGRTGRRSYRPTPSHTCTGLGHHRIISGLAVCLFEPSNRFMIRNTMSCTLHEDPTTTPSTPAVADRLLFEYAADNVRLLSELFVFLIACHMTVNRIRFGQRYVLCYLNSPTRLSAVSFAIHRSADTLTAMDHSSDWR
jgi:hypothetical protein